MMSAATFTFHDGISRRRVDPITVVGRLAECPGYTPALIDDAIEADDTAVLLVSEFAFFAFGVRPLRADGKGLTRLECVLLMHKFERWIVSLKAGR